MLKLYKFTDDKSDIKGDVRAEIAQLFKSTPLFQPFIILDLYLQHMESLTEITSSQAISARTSPSIRSFLLETLGYYLIPSQARIPIKGGSEDGFKPW